MICADARYLVPNELHFSKRIREFDANNLPARLCAVSADPNESQTDLAAGRAAGLETVQSAEWLSQSASELDLRFSAVATVSQSGCSGTRSSANIGEYIDADVPRGETPGEELPGGADGVCVCVSLEMNTRPMLESRS